MVKLFSLVFLLIMLFQSFPVFAIIYSWTDESGRVHYTSSPPAESGAKEYKFYKTEEPKQDEDKKEKKMSLLQLQALEIQKAKEQKSALIKLQQAEAKKHGRLCKINYYQMGNYLPEVVNSFTSNQHQYAQAAKKILNGYQNYGMNNYILKCKRKSLKTPSFEKALTCFVSINNKQEFTQCLTTLIESTKQDAPLTQK